MKIPFLSLKNTNQFLEEELKTAFTKFIDNGYYILGNSVASFEKNWAAFCHEKYSIGLANGLDALIVALSFYKFKAGSEVIVPANTYYASILAILKAGLKPILVEPDLDTYLISDQNIIGHISPKTVAILAVNLYGKMCDYEPLGDICKKHHLKLIVDAAQSHGATYKNKRNCPYADATAYSFYPSKNLGALADAGGLVTSNPDLEAFTRSYRNYGSSEKYVFQYTGLNSRLSELQAKFLEIKLKYLNAEITQRRAVAAFYFKNIKNEKIILPPASTLNEDAWRPFTVRTKDRNAFRAHLTSKGIGTEIHYPVPPHQQAALSDYRHMSLPITEKIHQEILSLPLNNVLSSEEMHYIADSINQY